jgi:hypothetical protein
MLEVEVASGAYVSTSAGRVTVRELAPSWLDKKKRSSAPSHYRTLESAWRTHVRFEWEAHVVAGTTILDVEAWISRLAAEVCGVTTVRRARTVLRAY